MVRIGDLVELLKHLDQDEIAKIVTRGNKLIITSKEGGTRSLLVQITLPAKPANDPKH